MKNNLSFCPIMIGGKGTFLIRFCLKSVNRQVYDGHSRRITYKRKHQYGYVMISMYIPWD